MLLTYLLTYCYYTGGATGDGHYGHDKYAFLRDDH